MLESSTAERHKLRANVLQRHVRETKEKLQKEHRARVQLESEVDLLRKKLKLEQAGRLSDRYRQERRTNVKLAVLLEKRKVQKAQRGPTRRAPRRLVSVELKARCPSTRT